MKKMKEFKGRKMTNRFLSFLLAAITLFTTVLSDTAVSFAKTDTVGGYKFIYDEQSPLLVTSIPGTPTEQDPNPAPTIVPVKAISFLQEEATVESEFATKVEDYFRGLGQLPEFKSNALFSVSVNDIASGMDTTLDGDLEVKVEVPSSVKTELLANSYLKLYRYSYDTQTGTISEPKPVDWTINNSQFSLSVQESGKYGFALGINYLHGTTNINGCDISYLGSKEVPADYQYTIVPGDEASIKSALQERIYQEKDQILETKDFRITIQDAAGNTVDGLTPASASIQTTVKIPEEMKTAIATAKAKNLDTQLVLYQYDRFLNGAVKYSTLTQRKDLNVDFDLGEVSFGAKSSESYVLALTCEVIGNDGAYEYINYTTGGVTKKLIKTDKTFSLQVPISWRDNGVKKYRPDSVTVVVYGGDQSGELGHDSNYIYRASLTIPDKNVDSPTLTINNLPIYINYEDRNNAENGTGLWLTAPNFYKVRVLPPAGYTNNSPQAFSLVKDENDKKWDVVKSATTVNTLQELVDQSFTLLWCDNRDVLEHRPFSNHATEQIAPPVSPEKWGDYFELWYKLDGSSAYQSVSRHADLFLPGMEDLEPTVKLIGTGSWNITFDNLPTTVDGDPISYYLGIKPEFLDQCAGDGYDYQLKPSDVTWAEDYSDKAFLMPNNQTTHLFYQFDFKGILQWNDGEDFGSLRPTNPSDVELVLYQNGVEYPIPADSLVWEETDSSEWKFRIKNLNQFTEDNQELEYNIKVKGNKIACRVDDGIHDYKVQYDNVPFSTLTDKCLSGGEIKAILQADTEAFHVNKVWLDGVQNQTDEQKKALRQPEIAKGMYLYLWRYTAKAGNTIENGSAVTEGGNQLYYKLKAEDWDDFTITLDMFTSRELPRYSEQGYLYVYYVTEAYNSSRYKTIYKNPGDDAQAKVAFHNGEIHNVRTKTTNLLAMKRWETVFSQDYVGSKVFLKLQEEKQVNGAATWVDVENVAPIEIDNFSLTQKNRSKYFNAVDIYDEEGELRKLRAVETKVNSRGSSYLVDENDYQPDGTGYLANYQIGGASYVVTSTYDTENLMLDVVNRVTNTLQLDFDIQWQGNFENWNEYVYQGVPQGVKDKDMQVMLNLYQDDVLYGRVEIKNTDDANKMAGIYDTTPDIRKAIYYPQDGSAPQELTVTISRDSVVHWKLSGIHVPAMNGGMPFVYTIRETTSQLPLETPAIKNASYYTLYDYNTPDAEHATMVARNILTLPGGNATSIISVQKKWNDEAITTFREPVTAVVVRVKENKTDYEYLVKENGVIKAVTPAEFVAGWGSTYKTSDLAYYAVLTEKNNWYSNIHLLNKDFLTDANDTSSMQWAVIEIMGNRVMKLEDSSDIAGNLAGSIDAASATDSEPIRMNFDTTISGNTVNCQGNKFVITNTRRGQAKVKIDKTWEDGDDANGLRKERYRVVVSQCSHGVPTGVTYPLELATDSSTSTYHLETGSLPLYDADGIAYDYEVQEFIVDGAEETEILLTETETTTVSGYVAKLTDHKEERIEDKKYTQIVTYQYVNSLLGLRKNETSFYKIWNDEYYFANNLRPDCYYTLYYSLGDGQIKKYDDNPLLPSYSMTVKTADTTIENSQNAFYQKIDFKGLPNGAYDENGEYQLYKFYLGQTYTGNYIEYNSVGYNPKDSSVPIAEATSQLIQGRTDIYHYQIGSNGEVSDLTAEDGMSVVKEKGAFEDSSEKKITIKGNKIWVNTEGVKTANLPQARIYLWRESDYDKENSKPAVINATTIKKNLNYDPANPDGGIKLESASKSGYQFEKQYEKYDKYGAVYNYSVSEVIVTDDENGYVLPHFIMNGSEDSLALTNTYETNSEFNKRSIVLNKEWDTSVWHSDYASLIGKEADVYGARAKFKLYQYEYPNPVAFSSGANVNLNEFTSLPAEAQPYKGTGQIKTIKIGDASQTVTWEDLPIYAPSGKPYVYFVEELTDQKMLSYDIDNDAAEITQGYRIDGLDKVAQNRKLSKQLVVISNYGINPYEAEENHLGSIDYKSTVEFNNRYIGLHINVLTGTKKWTEDKEFASFRPTLGEVNSADPSIVLSLRRSAATQVGMDNAVATEIIPSDKYEVVWKQDESNPDQWIFTITMADSIKLPQYAPNGQPYTYSVVESYKTGTNVAKNYKRANNSISASGTNVVQDEVDSTKHILKLTSGTYLHNQAKGSLTIQKAWEDYNNEYGLRSSVVKGVLQYRLVNKADANDYSSNPNYGWKIYVDPTGTHTDAEGVIELAYNKDNSALNWKKTITNLPVYGQSGEEEYEYRFVEFYVQDYGIVETVDYKDKLVIPDDYSGATGYVAATGELKIPLQGNHIIYEPKPVKLSSDANATVSTKVRNVLDSSKTTKILIQKAWDDENDCTGVRASKIQFEIQSRPVKNVETGEEYAWTTVKKDDGTPLILTLTSEFKDASGNWIATYSNLPKNGANDSKDKYVPLEYRAVELGKSLGRYNGYVSETAYMKGQKDGETGVEEYVDAHFDNANNTYVTSLKNKLTTRSLKITKKWNDNFEDHNEQVVIALYSKNFDDDQAENELQEVPGTERTLMLSADEKSYSTVYEKLPQKNKNGNLIQYYVAEKQIGEYSYSAAGYDLDVYYTTDSATYTKVVPTENTTMAYALVDHEINGDAVPATEVILVNTPVRSIQAKKVWVDETNRHNLRKIVTVSLYQKEGQTETLAKDAKGQDLVNSQESFTQVNGNRVVWEGLKSFQDVDESVVAGFKMGEGIPQEYVVKETALENYTTTYLTTDSHAQTENVDTGVICIDSQNDALDANLVTVTNTYVPKKASLAANKAWEDTNNQFGSRPESVYLSLYYRVGTVGDWTLIPHKDDIDAYQDGGIYTTSDVTQQLSKENGAANTWLHSETGTVAGYWENLPLVRLKTAAGVNTTEDIYYKVYETTNTPAAKITDPSDAGATIPSVVSGYSAKTSAPNGSSFELANLKKTQTLTNTLGRISVAIEKNWIETQTVATNVMRPTSITFTLDYTSDGTWKTYQNPEDTSKEYEVSVSASDNWQTVVTNLPQKDSQNRPYQYRVKEKYMTYGDTNIGTSGCVESIGAFDVSGKKWVGIIGGYQTEVGIVATTPVEGAQYSFKATAKNTLEEANLTVYKKWEDEENRDGIRPDGVILTLYRDGKKYGENVTVSGATNAYTWEQLPKYKNGSNAHDANNLSEYYVVETPVTGYVATYATSDSAVGTLLAADNKVKLVNSSNSIYVMNTHEAKRIAIGATKAWEDGNDIYQVRPNSATLKLQYQLAGESTWKDVTYIASPSLKDVTGYNVETTSVISQTVTKKATDTDNVWAADGWYDLPVYAKNASGESKKVTYRVQEVDTDSNYTSNDDTAACKYTYTDGDSPVTIPVVNQIIGSEYSYTVKKEWGDYDTYLAHGVIPKKVHVQLQCSTDTGATWKDLEGSNSSYDLLAQDNWSYTFTGLNSAYQYRAYESYLVYEDENQNEQKVYPNTQNPLAGEIGSFTYAYEEESSHANVGSGILKNEMPHKVLEVKKEWDDEANRDGVRKLDVTVELYRDGQIIATDVLNQLNNWSVSYNDLPVYQNGKAAIAGNESSYQIIEQDVDNYQTTYIVDDGARQNDCTIQFSADLSSQKHEVTVVNQHIPKKTTAYVDEVWMDGHDQCGARPDAVYVSLQYRVGETGEWNLVLPYEKASFEAAGDKYPDCRIYTTSDVTQKVSVDAMIDKNKEEDLFAGCGIWQNLPLIGSADGVELPQKVYYRVVQTTQDATAEFIPHGYTVEHSAILAPAFDQDIRGEITNKLIETSLEVTKTWKDGENLYLSRPESVQFTLQRRLKVEAGQDENTWEPVLYKKNWFTKATLITLLVKPDQDGIWKGSFEALPVYDVTGKSNQIYEYRAVETELVYEKSKQKFYPSDEQNIDGGQIVASYESTSAVVSGNDIYQQTVSNALKTTTLTVEKSWEDEHNQWKTRPSAIRFVIERKEKKLLGTLLELLGSDAGWETVSILENGTKVPLSVTMEGPDFNQVTISNLPGYSMEQKEYLYRAREEALIYPAGEILLTESGAPYHVKTKTDAIEKEGNKEYHTAVTNHLQTVDISITKKWNDKKNLYKVRPEKLKLSVTNQNGKKVEHISYKWEKKESKWTCKVNGLPKYLPGTTIKAQYMFTEENVKHYEAKAKNIAEKDGKVLFENSLSKEFIKAMQKEEEKQKDKDKNKDLISDDHSNGSAENAKQGDLTKTGDETPIVLWWSMFGIAMIGLIGSVVGMQKRRKEKESS